MNLARIFRRSAGRATALRANLFTWARIKLTVVYLIIILFVIGVYSTVLFFGLRRNIRGNEDFRNGALEQYSAEKAIDHIQALISSIDIVMFMIAAAGSFALAGITLRPIRRSLEAQEAFSADASHELRTPLAVMKTDIEVLLRGPEKLSETTRTILNSNLEEIRFMSDMTTQLLELSRGAFDTHNAETFDAGSLLQETAERFKSLAQQAGLKITIQVQPVFIEAERPAVARVFQNLLANAITYTPEGGAIQLTATKMKDFAVITFADNGIGIGAGDIPHVFKRFYKADASRTSKRTSTGLGLSLAKQIVERNSGTIDLRSEIGVGTTVTVRFIHTSSSTSIM